MAQHFSELFQCLISALPGKRVKKCLLISGVSVGNTLPASYRFSGSNFNNISVPRFTISMQNYHNPYSQYICWNIHKLSTQLA